jgi:hypothetical protein
MEKAHPLTSPAMPDVESIAIALGLFLTVYQLHLSRKGMFIEVAQKNRERYARLLEDRNGLSKYYQDLNFNLEKLKVENEEDFDALIHHETQYFWFVFDSWIEGHVRKSIPRYLRKDWDYGVKQGMKNPVHRQSWKAVIQNMDFLGYRKFNEFIQKCYEEGGV